MTYAIRPYAAGDRSAVRRLSCATAFFGLPRERIFADDEALADFLTLYFTDHEPGSCLVVEDAGGVAGYLLGARDVRAMRRHAQPYRGIFLKMLRRGTLLSPTNLLFAARVGLSFLKGEFSGRDVSEAYPATLHVNLESRCRRQGVGRALIEAYVGLLRRASVSGVHLTTLSPEARQFFLKTGFNDLYRKNRSFLRPYAGREVTSYVMGMSL
ncbi:MAG: hypothetical protein ACM3L6_06725 [Deltaproteobacteria bacterium]